MPISYDVELFEGRMAVIQNIKWAKKTLALAKEYVNCIRAGGITDPYPDCMRILMDGAPNGIFFAPQGPSIIGELLALMPDDAQEQVAGLMLEAQERLLERYHAELEELTG